jgi:hypothetical protein
MAESAIPLFQQVLLACSLWIFGAITDISTPRAHSPFVRKVDVSLSKGASSCSDRQAVHLVLQAGWNERKAIA